MTLDECAEANGGFTCRDCIDQAIHEAVAEEREACAKIAQDHGYYGPGVCDEIADAIRARSAPSNVGRAG